jgi:3alpha(or 20beta)-hydroxysteroid dehydrogenase
MDRSRKVGIITGAARGIEEACARRLASGGASVVVTDVIDEEGQQLASTIREEGGNAPFQHHDVSDEASWETVIGKTVAEFGGIHILVNNAGIGTFDDVEQETVEGWNRLISVTIKRASGLG